MSDDFDPYRELLGIEAGEGPPNHYVLLGLPAFESDRDRIDEAAGERMALLQEFANSEHLDASQKLLNEVSAARRCLLDSTKKIAYDEDLRSRQKRTAGSSAGRKGARSKAAPLLPVGVAVIVAAVLLVIFLLLRRDPAASGNLVVEWPLHEREGAEITMDGEVLPVPDTDPIELQIPDGRHRMLFRRSGYEDIPKTFQFSDVRVKMKLRWIRKK